MEGTSQPAKWMQSDAEAARGAVLHHVGAMTPGPGSPEGAASGGARDASPHEARQPSCGGRHSVDRMMACWGMDLVMISHLPPSGC